MRRKYVLIIAILLGIVLLLFFFRPQGGQAVGKFVPVGPGFKVPPYKNVGYQFLHASPFEGGKMWVRTDRRWFLYDLEAKQVLGELINDWPVFLNGDQSKVLVHSDDPSVFEAILKFFDKARGGSSNLAGISRGEPFRLLDLKSNKSVRIGRLYEAQGSGHEWGPSPGFRYAFNWPTVKPLSGDAYLCDLQEEQVKKVQFGGDPVSWWDEKSILLETFGRDLALYNVETRQTSILVPATVIDDFLRKNQINVDRSDVHLFGEWLGGRNHFYLTEGRKRFQGTNSFLAKLEQPSGALKMVTNEFKFEWSDHFDAAGRYYLYSGREIGKASAAVYVRDLENGTTRTLVPDDGTLRFSLPRWYGNDVIYVRSNMLWQISLTNNNPTRLFPPL